LTQTGGFTDSSTLTCYLIAGQIYSKVTIAAENEDAGIEWKFSDDNVLWYDTLQLLAVGIGATTIYAKAVVANDGTITTDKVSADARVLGW
jgi:hypothetical protein